MVLYFICGYPSQNVAYAEIADILSAISVFCNQ